MQVFNLSCVLQNPVRADFQPLIADTRNVIVIYISTFDIFNAGKPIYHVRNHIQETGKVVDDGLQMVYVNAKCIDETAISRLMQLYKKPDFEDEAFPRSSARMYKLKHDEREVAYMCSIVKEREDIAKRENTIELTKKMIKSKKLSYEEIASITELTLKEIYTIANKNV